MAQLLKRSKKMDSSKCKFLQNEINSFFCKVIKIILNVKLNQRVKVSNVKLIVQAIVK
jgi:hypothetical protein